MTLVGNVHIAAGNSSDIDAALALLADDGIDMIANPDLSVRIHKNFGIDDARELSTKAASRAIGARRVFLIAADSISHEAQNALLKTLEEAPGNALFFFIVPNPDSLLPTVKSRAQVLHVPHGEPRKSHIDTEMFVNAPVAERLDMLKPLLEKDEEDKRDLGAALAFLASLEAALSRQPQSLPAVYRARKYITDRGALTKALLEQVALLI